MHEQITFLKDSIKTAKLFVSEADAKLALTDNETDKLIANLEKNTYIKQVSELQESLHLAQAERDHEVIDLHLTGDKADFGSIPLKTLSNLIVPLNALIEDVACKIRHSADPRQIPTDITNDLDLRFAGTATGSTHLILTGNVSSDLAGDSLLGDSLELIFDLLNTESQDEFYDKAHAIGIRASSNLDSLLIALSKNGLNLDFNWNAPNKEFKWDGNCDGISRVKFLLENVTEPKVIIETMTGKVDGFRDSSKNFFLILEDQSTITARFTKIQHEQIIAMKITIGSIVKCTIEKTSYYNKAKDETVNKYRLLGVELNNDNPPEISLSYTPALPEL